MRGDDITDHQDLDHVPKSSDQMNNEFDKETESVLPSSRELDISPSASCNASQMLMKSLMTSYNAGNVQFYENLHRKYFDKAKGAKNDSKVADPPS